jgi:xanthine dehydrogenase small subunit
VNGETKLHPVQQALVDLNGSQCGYCTPGIIMSMFALYKNLETPDRKEIEDGLTGNLCRCTGYAPILKATLKAIEEKVHDQFTEKEKETVNTLRQIQSKSKTLEIISSNQTYLQPRLLKELFSFLNKYPKAILLNGSTDVALKQTKKFEHLATIIDISAIEELKKIEHTEKGFYVGAGVSLEVLRTSLAKEHPALQQMLDVFASRQIRELATLGGNVGTASPIGDTLPLLFALKARLKIAGEKKESELNIEDFITGYRKTALQKGEIIKSVFIPKKEADIIKFYKVSKRKDLDISTVNAGFRIQLQDNIVADIFLAFGGMAEITKRAKKTESYLMGKVWDENTVNIATELLYSEFIPISDARSGKGFRKLAAKNLLLKFYSETNDE